MDAAVIRDALGGGHAKGRRLSKAPQKPHVSLTPEQRLLLLDTWQRSGLPAGDFASLVGVAKYTLYAWKTRFEAQGPAGLMDGVRRKPREDRVSEVTRRTIVMLKEGHPEYGCQRISDLLARGPGLAACASTVAKVLHEAGYELEEEVTKPHAPPVKRFERSRPGAMWQSDLFTFVLKRQNRRVYLVAYLDDHSRFVTGFGIHASPSTAMVIEVLRTAIRSYPVPEELLTDNGPQYVTWRGKSAFAKECEKLGIRQVVATPRHPRTCGKIERFWGTLWRALLQRAIFVDLEDARQRIGCFIDHYNFHRPHQALDGLVPADRFFEAAPQVKETLKARVAENALELAERGLPRKPFYLTGQMGGQAFTLHAEGERVYLTHEDGRRQEVDLVAPDGLGGTERVGEDADSGGDWDDPAGDYVSETEDGMAPDGDAELPDMDDGGTGLPGAGSVLASELAGQEEHPGVPASPALGNEGPRPPGTSPLDEGLSRLARSLRESAGEGTESAGKEVES
jgi:transposase InsO family protein